MKIWFSKVQIQFMAPFENAICAWWDTIYLKYICINYSYFSLYDLWYIARRILKQRVQRHQWKLVEWLFFSLVMTNSVRLPLLESLVFENTFSITPLHTFCYTCYTVSVGAVIIIYHAIFGLYRHKCNEVKLRMFMIYLEYSQIHSKSMNKSTVFIK